MLLRVARLLSLFIIGTLLIVSPVLAYSYSSSVAIAESNGTTYTMLPVLWGQNNSWMASNGFMNSTANDTRVQTLGGLDKPWMVADNKTLTAIPVPADSQTNLYFVTGESEASAMNIITGRGGYVTTDDVPAMEPSGNFTASQDCYIDLSKTGDIVFGKDDAFSCNVTGSDELTGYIYQADADVTPTGHVDGASAWTNETNAYDGNTGTFAQDADITDAWSEYLELTVTPMWADSVRVWSVKDGSHTQIDVDVYYSDAWHDALTGTGYTNADWTTIDLGGDYYVSSLRFRQLIAGSSYAVLYEADFSRIEAYSVVTTTPVANGEQEVGLTYFTNPIYNSSFEVGSPPTGWSNGESGTTATFERTAAESLFGDYSFAITNEDGHNAVSAFPITLDSYAGNTVTAGVWMKASVANRVYLSIWDGVGETASSYHSGGGAWEWVSATRTLDATATYCHVYACRVWAGTPTTAYFDGAVAVEGSSIPNGYNNFYISVDGAVVGETAVDGNITVPDNANDTQFGSDATPYINSISMTIGGTVVTQYQPTSMIIGTNLPDKTGNSHNGTITWGSNPAGVGVTLGSLISSGQPDIGSSSDTSTSDILPSVGGTDGRPEATVSAQLQANPMRSIVVAISDNTTLSEYQVWVWFGAIFVVFILALTGANVRGHHTITGIATGAAIVLMVVWTVFPIWTLVAVILAIVLGHISERSPSL